MPLHWRACTCDAAAARAAWTLTVVKRAPASLLTQRVVRGYLDPAVTMGGKGESPLTRFWAGASLGRPLDFKSHSREKCDMEGLLMGEAYS